MFWLFKEEDIIYLPWRSCLRGRAFRPHLLSRRKPVGRQLLLPPFLPQRSRSESHKRLHVPIGTPAAATRLTGPGAGKGAGQTFPQEVLEVPHALRQLVQVVRPHGALLVVDDDEWPAQTAPVRGDVDAPGARRRTEMGLVCPSTEGISVLLG